jgi:hypothetical protein
MCNIKAVAKKYVNLWKMKEGQNSWVYTTAFSINVEQTGATLDQLP